MVSYKCFLLQLSQISSIYPSYLHLLPQVTNLQLFHFDPPIPPCYGLNCVPPPSSYVETLNLSVAAFGIRTFKEVIKIK